MGIFGKDPCRQWTAACLAILKRLDHEHPLERQFVEKLPGMFFAPCVEWRNAQLAEDTAGMAVAKAKIDRFWEFFDLRFRKLGVEHKKTEEWGAQWKDDLEVLVRFSSLDHFRGVSDCPDAESMYVREIETKEFNLREVLSAIIDRYGVSGVSLPRA